MDGIQPYSAPPRPLAFPTAAAANPAAVKAPSQRETLSAQLRRSHSRFTSSSARPTASGFIGQKAERYKSASRASQSIRPILSACTTMAG